MWDDQFQNTFSTSLTLRFLLPSHIDNYCTLDSQDCPKIIKFIYQKIRVQVYLEMLSLKRDFASSRFAIRYYRKSLSCPSLADCQRGLFIDMYKSWGRSHMIGSITRSLDQTGGVVKRRSSPKSTDCKTGLSSSAVIWSLMISASFLNSSLNFFICGSVAVSDEFPIATILSLEEWISFASWAAKFLSPSSSSRVSWRCTTCGTWTKQRMDLRKGGCSGDNFLQLQMSTALFLSPFFECSL